MKLLILIAAVGCLAAVAVEAQNYPMCNSTVPCPANFTGCNIYSQCNFGLCETCISGYDFDTTVIPYACAQSNVQLGVSCSKDVQCMGGFTTSCTGGKCECFNSTYIAKSDKTGCDLPQPAPAPQLKLGSACNATMNNCGDGATCSEYGLWANSTCKCLAEYTASDDTDCTHTVTYADQGQLCAPAKFQLCKGSLECVVCPEAPTSSSLCRTISGSSTLGGSAAVLLFISAALLLLLRLF